MKDGMGFSDSVSIEVIDNKGNVKKNEENDILNMSILELKKKFKDKGLDISQVLSALALIFKNSGDKNA